MIVGARLFFFKKEWLPVFLLLKLLNVILAKSFCYVAIQLDISSENTYELLCSLLLK